MDAVIDKQHEQIIGTPVSRLRISVLIDGLEQRVSPRNRLTEVEMLCQPGTSVHKIHVNCISHVTVRHLLTHLGCVYNRSL
jgi:hypothetical protein